MRQLTMNQTQEPSAGVDLTDPRPRYEAPAVRDLGSLTELTHGGGAGPDGEGFGGPPS